MTGTLAWAGGEHAFALRLGELRALQDATNAGPEELLQRIRGGRWRVDDVIEVVRWGLIGGGLDRTEATRLVLRAAEHALAIGGDGMLALKPIAMMVLTYALAGPPDDVPGKPEGEAAPLENGVSA